MIATCIVSLLLIGLSGVLLDSHRRSWRAAQQNESISPADLRFARSQYRRRTQASGTIGVLGAVLGVYPLVPHAPLAITLYLVAITLACLAIMLLAVLDAWASRQNFMRLRGEQLATQVKLARDLDREQTRFHDG
jgi:VIT1/CCC1 family predicted Fe2+/Mn2+ transporter